jgi:CRP/FNR family transcriptional regulator
MQKPLITDCRTCTIRCHSVFDKLTPEELIEVNAMKDTNLYKKGQVIFYEGNHPKGIFIVYSGKVKVYKSGSSARDQIVRLARPGDILGYRSLMSDDRYHASAAALEDSQVCFIPKAQLMQLMNRNSSLPINLMKLLSNDLAGAERKLVELSQKPVRERVAEAVLILKDMYGTENDGKTLNVIMSREDMAKFVGSTTETTIRILSDLKDEEVLSFNKKKIVVENLPKLIKISHVDSW